MTETIVRVIVVGTPQKWRGGSPISPNFDLARKMLKQAVDHRGWPKARVLFAITPGGFVQGRVPAEYDGRRSWASRSDDFRSLIPTAENAVSEVIDEDIRANLAKRARFLTVGVDLVAAGQSKTAGGSGTQAQMVGVVDLDQGAVVRWTGKSYPTGDEERVLVQEPNLKSHLLRVAGQRVLLLGCHDLNMFSGRARANAKNERRRRWQDMNTLAHQFKPTMVLHHPHQTDEPATWRAGWSGLRQFLGFNGPYASGIAYSPYYRRARHPLEGVLRVTKSDDVIDVRVNGYWSREWEHC